MRPFNLLLLLIFALFTSCDSTNIVSVPDEIETLNLPLKIGNTWEYKLIKTSFKSGEIDSSETVTFSITADTLVDGIRWYLYESEEKHYNRLFGGYFSVQKDGIFKVGLFPSEIQSEQTTSGYYSSWSPVTREKLSSNLTKLNPPFFHQPDIRVPERLTQIDSYIASTIYKGQLVSNENEIRHRYVKNTYQMLGLNRAITLVPFELDNILSNSQGFIVLECAYYTKQQTEGDDRFEPSLLYRIELIDFRAV